MYQAGRVTSPPSLTACYLHVVIIIRPCMSALGRHIVKPLTSDTSESHYTLPLYKSFTYYPLTFTHTHTHTQTHSGLLKFGIQNAVLKTQRIELR